jgi:pilus assembly protein CpaF
MTTCHSNSARDTLARLETMTLMAGMDLPVRAIREQISSAVQLICHLERLRDGSRKVVKSPSPRDGRRCNHHDRPVYL